MQRVANVLYDLLVQPAEVTLPMVEKTAERACPVCDGRDALVVHHQRFVVPENYPLPAAFDVVACARCGNVYSDTAASQAVYDAYYERFSVYEDQKTSSGSGVSGTDAQRLSDVAAWLDECVADKDTAIVDIGCANGFLLGRLKARGFSRLLGVDPSAACVANMRALGLEGAQGSLTRLDKNLGTFDVVILSHVVEHLRDPRAVLGNVVALLRPGGCIYVEVPDAARYKDYLVAPFQDFNTEHINHFSSASLANLMRALGFESTTRGAKVFESSPNMPFPAIFGLWRREPSHGPVVYERDDLLASLTAYVSASNAMLERMSRTIAKVLEQAPKVVVWGTGQLAMKLLLETSLADADIVALIDSNPANHGKKIRGIAVEPPEALARYPYPIIVSSTIHHDAIAATIRQSLRLSNDIVSLKEDAS